MDKAPASHWTPARRHHVVRVESAIECQELLDQVGRIRAAADRQIAQAVQAHQAAMRFEQVEERHLCAAVKLQSLNGEAETKLRGILRTVTGALDRMGVESDLADPAVPS